MKKLLLLGSVFFALVMVTAADSFSQYDGNMNMVDVNGKRQGAWKITAAMMKWGPPWTPSQIVKEGSYKDGYRVGTWVEYNSMGDKIEEWKFDLDNHLLLKKQFEDSRLIAETNFDYWLHDHLMTFTDERGSYSMIVPYEFIRHEGVAKNYYPDGTLWVEMTWKDGRLDGPMTTYYPNGKVCEEGWWKYSGWIGGYKLYNKNGKLLQEIAPPLVVIDPSMINTVTN